MTQPAKRGPGRPRKQPAPTADPAAVTPEPVETTTVADDKPAKKVDGERDERIGLAAHPNTEKVSFGDGSKYRCEDGKIVERVY